MKEHVQYLSCTDKTTQEAVETPAKKIDRKKPEDPYKDLLDFSENRQSVAFLEQ